MIYLSDLEEGDYIEHDFMGSTRAGFINHIGMTTATFGPSGEIDLWLVNEEDMENVNIFKKEDNPEYYL